MAENIHDGKPTDFDIKRGVGEIMELSKNASSLLHSELPSQVKMAINNFVDRVEIDHKNRKATFFVYNIPEASKTYDEIVSVKTCRRSESNTICIMI